MGSRLSWSNPNRTLVGRWISSMTTNAKANTKRQGDGRTKKISRKQRFSSARTKSDASIRRKPRLKAKRRARLRRQKRESDRE